MTTIEYKDGDDVQMLIGDRWLRCTIIGQWAELHWSGQLMQGFQCRFSDGAIICCGRNSLRKLKGLKAQPAAFFSG